MDIVIEKSNHRARLGAKQHRADDGYESWSRKFHRRSESALRTAFDMFDTSGDGRLQVKDLQEVLRENRRVRRGR